MTMESDTMKRNVYDFDHTIYNGDSTIDFFRFCVKKDLTCLLNLPHFVFYVCLYFLNLVDKKALKEAYFAFLKRIKNIDQAVEEFWELYSVKLADWYLKGRACDDIVVTASPEFLVKPICSALGISCVIGSGVDKITGAFFTENCSGLEKVKRLQEKIQDCKIVCFYSDSLSDCYLAAIAEQAYIVKKDGNIVPWNDYRESFSHRMKNTFVTPKFVVFVFCGGIGTLVSFIVSLLLSRTINPIVSYVVAYSFSLFVTYSLNAKLVFKSSFNIKNFMRFLISYFPNFCILVSFVYIFLNIFSWNRAIVYGLAGFLGLPVTYVLVKTYAFSESHRNRRIRNG